MSRHQKLVHRLRQKPKDFTYSELVRLMKGFGYEESSVGKTSGSAVAFINRDTQQVVRLHRPHPGNIVKSYVIKNVLDHLIDQKLIE